MVLLYFMDGLRYDLAMEHMPFLSSLHTLPLESEFGYSCACHATMYTSRYICEHGTWFVWERGDASPYGWIRRIPPLGLMNCLPVKAAASRLSRRMHPNRAYPGIPMLVHLPLKDWPLFQPAEDRFWSDEDYLPGLDTLFKLVRREGIRHTLVGLEKGSDPFRDEAQVDYARDQLVYFFLGEVDSVMHRCGTSSPETAAYLRCVDDFIRLTCDKAQAAQGQITVIAWSDHGHIDVKRRVDLADVFRAHRLSLDRYIHLTESTFARFWPRDEKEQNEIVAVLQGLENEGLGSIMTPALLSQWHLPTDKARYGGLIFHLSAPNLFEKTIWGYGRKTVSMHGYDPTLPENHGIFAGSLPLLPRQTVRLTDILPTIVHALDLEETGRGFQGCNVMEGPRHDEA